MKRGLLTRLARLEVRTSSAECRVTVRFGHLKRLPPEYVGERHVVARELPSQGDQEWVAFEEVPGPEPESLQPPTRRGDYPIETRLDVMFVNAGPYPEQVGAV
jgi:hypothetical protein